VSRGNRFHFATTRNFAGCVSDGGIDIYHWLKTSGNAMVLGSTQLTKKMTTTDIWWGEGGQCLGFGKIRYKRPALGSVHPSWIL